jgi:hypothetical protein
LGKVLDEGPMGSYALLNPFERTSFPDYPTELVMKLAYQVALLNENESLPLGSPTSSFMWDYCGAGVLYAYVCLIALLEAFRASLEYDKSTRSSSACPPPKTAWPAPHIDATNMKL